jgi:hypothetical protein
VVITVHARFVAFLERMGGSEALQGLEHVPLSSLPAAVSFIQGHGAPSQAELQLGVKVRAPPPTPHALHQHPTDYMLWCVELTHAYKYAAVCGADSRNWSGSPVQRAYAKIDTLLAQGPDTWGLTRDEMAAIHIYTAFLQILSYRAVDHCKRVPLSIQAQVRFCNTPMMNDGGDAKSDGDVCVSGKYLVTSWS